MISHEKLNQVIMGFPLAGGLDYLKYLMVCHQFVRRPVKKNEICPSGVHGILRCVYTDPQTC